jgi:hypothetical protein
VSNCLSTSIEVIKMSRQAEARQADFPRLPITTSIDDFAGLLSGCDPEVFGADDIGLEARLLGSFKKANCSPVLLRPLVPR